MEGLRNNECELAEESVETERVIGLVMKAIEDDVRQMAKAIVSRRDDELLGPGEFDLRDRVLKAACHILEAAINDRKKGGTKAAARIVQTVAKTRDSWSGEARRSQALSAP
jgi:hypothetical protein